jgi:hypothetical protein
MESVQSAELVTTKYNAVTEIKQTDIRIKFTKSQLPWINKPVEVDLMRVTFNNADKCYVTSHVPSNISKKMNQSSVDKNGRVSLQNPDLTTFKVWDFFFNRASEFLSGERRRWQ